MRNEVLARAIRHRRRNCAKPVRQGGNLQKRNQISQGYTFDYGNIVGTCQKRIPQSNTGRNISRRSFCNVASIFGCSLNHLARTALHGLQNRESCLSDIEYLLKRYRHCSAILHSRDGRCEFLGKALLLLA